MNVAAQKHFNLTGAADSLSTGKTKPHSSFSETGCSIGHDQTFPAKLVIIEPMNLETRLIENIQKESVDEGNISTNLISCKNGEMLADIPCKLELGHNKVIPSVSSSTVSIKLPLGKYEVSKVSKPQINLIAASLTSQINPLDDSNVSFISITKPRSTPAREAVDPAKYFVLTDEPDGTKYACSKCGNVYKWRKSLNKHWKEKHDGEVPPSLADREKMLKCPPQNFPKHSTLQVAPVSGQKSLLLSASASASLNAYKPTTQVRLPSRLYSLVNIKKPEIVDNKSLMMAIHSFNSHPRSQITKKDEHRLIESPPIYQPSQHILQSKREKSNTSLVYDNSGVLDLSLKSNEEKMNNQDEPIDFSLKFQLSQNDDFHSTPSDLRIISSLSGHENRELSCSQCDLQFGQMFDLNSHFNCNHMDCLIAAADDFRLVSSQSCTDPLNHKESFQCLICGVSENWLWKLAKHFDRDHCGIEPNPYKAVSNGLCHLASGSPSLTADAVCLKNEFSGTNSSAVFSSRQINAEALLKKLGISKSSDLDFDNQVTAIVIPKAPEETVTYTDSFSLKQKSTEIPIFSDDGMSYILPESQEDTLIENTKISFCHNKTNRGKKENSNFSGDIILPFECKLCGYRARWRSEMTQHMKNHSDEKPYQCPQCSYRSKWKWDVVKHLKRCGGNKSQSELPQKRRRSFPKSLSETSSNDALNENVVAWKQESFSPENSSNGLLNITLFSNYQPNKKYFDSEESPEFQKKELNEDPHQRSCLEQHSNLHPCSQCHFVGHSPAELKRHKRVHSDEKPYSCKTCRYSSKWKCDLKKHVRTYNHIAAVPLIHSSLGQRSLYFLNNSSDDAASVVEDKEEESPREKEFSSDGVIKCEECKFEAPSLSVLVAHEKCCKRKNFNGSHSSDVSCSSIESRKDNFKFDFLLGLGLQPKEFSKGEEALTNYLPWFKTIESMGFTSGSAFLQTNKFGSIEPYRCNETDAHSSSFKLKKNNNIKRFFFNKSYCKFKQSEFHMPTFNRSLSTVQAYSKLFSLQVITLNGLRLKLITKAGVRFYGCVKCPYVSRSSFRAVYHSRDHESLKRFKCSSCGYKSNQRKFISSHSVLFHGRENSYNKNRLNVKIYKHFRILCAMDLIRRKNVCINCGYASLNYAKLLRHRLARPCFRLLVRQLDDAVLTCCFCSYKTEKKLVLAQHAKYHGSDLKYGCPKCDFRSDLLNIILNHRKYQHQL